MIRLTLKSSVPWKAHGRRWFFVRILAAAVSLVALFASLSAECQITSITDQTSTPVPGSGHDYIQDLSEIVNPANGAVSIRIKLPTAKARGFTLPFYIAYDTNGTQLPLPSSTLTSWVPDTPAPSAPSDFSPFSSGGWTYSIPLASWTLDAVYQAQPEALCEFSAGYMFYDPTGARHALYVGTELVNPSNVSVNNPNCQGGFGLTGGDGHVNASVGQPTLGNSGAIPLTVSDADGTVYRFAGHLGNTSGISTWNLPSEIEDRNGNTFQVAGQSAPGSVNVTDSLGRPAISISGTGPNGSNTTNTISVPGQSFTVNWTTTTANYTPPYTNENVPGASCYDNIAGINDTFSVISSILLPNNKSYNFYYGNNVTSGGYPNPYGLINEIDYPSGAWVRYKWKLSDTPSSIVDYPAYNQLATDGNLCAFVYPAPVVASRLVGLSGSSTAISEQDFTYWTDLATLAGTGSASPYKTTTVVTADNIRKLSYQTTYKYVVDFPKPNSTLPAASHPNPYEQSIVVDDWNSKLLTTTTKALVGNGLDFLLCQFQTNSANLSSGDFYQYQYGQVSDDKEYGFGQVSSPASVCNATATAAPTSPVPVRETATNYKAITSPQEGGSGKPIIFGKPSSVLLYDGSTGSQVRVKETDYTYDGGTLAGVTAGLPANTHDNSLYPQSVVSGRGNVTQMTGQCIGCNNSTTTYAYDFTGQVVSKTDPCGNSTCADMVGTSHTTTYSHQDNPTGGNSAGNSNAYLTQITAPSTGVAHIESYQYNYATGELSQTKDQNNILTNYSYQDPLDRLTLVDSAPGTLDAGNNPAESKTQYKYPSLTEVDVEQDQNVPGDTVLKSSTFYDGLGRMAETIGRDLSVVRTANDGLGRVCAVSNPTFNDPGPLSCVVGANKGTPPTDGYTYFSYDALGRKTLQTQPDNTTQRWVYNGNVVDFYDEDNSHWQWTRDALGRLTKTMENDPGGSGQLTLETDYTYNALDDLLSVNQIGGSGYTARYRTFAYDSLSRLTNACNPEAVNPALLPCTTLVAKGPWSAVYAYDANGNATTRTDARGIVTRYTYDALNRLAGKSYTNDPANTPALSYGYDTEYPWQLVANENHPKGHLNSIMATLGSTNLVTWTSNDYDQRGTLLGYANCLGVNAQSCPGAFTTAAYGFNLIENLNAMGLIAGGATNNGQGEAIYPAYDSAGRVNSIVTSLSLDTSGNSLTSTAFSGLTYFPGGAVKTANLAIDPTTQTPGITLTRTYDNRGRITGETDQYSQTQSAYKYSVSYDGNGNVTGFNDSVAGDWTVKNDALHRLSSSTGTVNGVAASFQESYDPFGNRYVEYYTYKGVQNQPSPYLHFTAGNNRIDNGSYDYAGNLLSDGTNNYLYDAENRLCAVQQATTGGEVIGYLYSPEGTRLGKGNITQTFSCDMTKNGMLTANVPVLTNLYTVGPDGEQLEEVGTANNYNYLHFNVFWEGKLLGTYTGSTYAESNWHFALNDWVGTKRQVTTSAGVPSTSFFSGPFGDYLSQNGSGPDQTEQHFTGKERDTESGLDSFPARYYNSNRGRFLSPDWGGPGPDPDAVPWADYENPQSLNLYGYVGNNPLSSTDDDGHDYYLQGGGQCGQNGIDCDQEGYVLNSFGSRAVVTDQALANGTYGASAGANGGVNITTGQGTFAGQFFDASPGAISATVNADPSISGFSQSFIQQTNAYNQAAMPMLNTMAINSAASLGIMGAAEAAMGTGMTTLGDVTLTPTSGESAYAQRVLAQGGRKSVERAIRTLSKRLAEHEAKLGNLQGNPASVEREIAGYRRTIEALSQVLR
jgi:RHS repeat-associated protein